MSCQSFETSHSQVDINLSSTEPKRIGVFTKGWGKNNDLETVEEGKEDKALSCGGYVWAESSPQRSGFNKCKHWDNIPGR